jgi:hypothetical protein
MDKFIFGSPHHWNPASPAHTLLCATPRHSFEAHLTGRASVRTHASTVSIAVGVAGVSPMRIEASQLACIYNVHTHTHGKVVLSYNKATAKKEITNPATELTLARSLLNNPFSDPLAHCQCHQPSPLSHSIATSSQCLLRHTAF